MTTTLVFIAIGLVLLIISIYTLLNFNRLRKNGVLTDGVIFDLEDSGSSDNGSKFPVIRFTTSSGEWITHVYRIGIFPGFYKRGTKVKVIYNPDKPTDFLLKATYSTIVPIVIIVTALVFLSIGIVRLFSIEL